MPETVGQRDPVYLFLCHLEWRNSGNQAAYLELVAALNDCNYEVRDVAETLLGGSSERPVPNETRAEVR